CSKLLRTRRASSRASSAALRAASASLRAASAISRVCSAALRSPSAARSAVLRCCSLSLFLWPGPDCDMAAEALLLLRLGRGGANRGGNILRRETLDEPVDSFLLDDGVELGAVSHDEAHALDGDVVHL